MNAKKANDQDIPILSGPKSSLEKKSPISLIEISIQSKKFSLSIRIFAHDYERDNINQS